VDDPYLAEVDTADLSRAVAAVMLAEGHTTGQVTVVLTDDEAVAALNRQYRGEPGPTDVLAFSYQEPTPGFVSSPDAPAYLGTSSSRFPSRAHRRQGSGGPWPMSSGCWRCTARCTCWGMIMMIPNPKLACGHARNSFWPDWGARPETLLSEGTMAARMTKRERLLATVAGQPVDRIAMALWRHFPGMINARQISLRRRSVGKRRMIGTSSRFRRPAASVSWTGVSRTAGLAAMRATGSTSSGR